MPESRHKYLFERLGDHDFQQLVGALLARQFPDFTPMALRQSDGGRDGIRQIATGNPLVYQVKWSVRGQEKDPVAWLDAAVRQEEENLKRLAAEGVRSYVLVTNIASTARARSGTFDRLNRKLDEHAKRLGLEQMSCVWREALNAWVDNAPDEIKWAYADMLVGWDQIRYLIAEQVGTKRDQGLRALVRKVASAQWDEDQGIKFSQSDVDRERVVDLFVDVHAERVRSIQSGASASLPLAGVGGAAAYLLNAKAPFTLVRGAPGQGKSTLSQYVSQAHRAAFVPEAERPPRLSALTHPRFPLRCDLSDYARWLSGFDPWEAGDEPPKRRKRPSGNQATIECFLAAFMTYASGGLPVDARAVQDLFERVPSIVVLDGLDEVGNATARAKVVAAIDHFVSRARSYADPPRVLVTTRPSAGELPEPSSQAFEVLALNTLTPSQRAEYLRRWCTVRGIHAREGRALRKNFNDRSTEPFIDELAGNPMQLTILLDLLHKHGLATPTQRTELYDDYVELLMAREANKHPDVVRRHREELLEMIPFLGWYLQAHSEEAAINAQMIVAELKAAMRHFQSAYGNPPAVVDDLFVATSDRLWALTSKVEGTYEFEVLSMREYFAARYLYRNAGEDQPSFDRATVLQELLRRPYWLNVARFYAGNARGSDLYAVAAGIEDELQQSPSAPSFLASWAVLTDGVFLRRPREARRVLTALCSDAGLPVLLPALTRRDITPLPQLPELPDSDGPDPTWQRLTDAIKADPADSLNGTRVAALRDLLNAKQAFALWWLEQATEAASTRTQTPWLRLAATCEAAAGLQLNLPAQALVFGDAELALNTGGIPPSGSDLEAMLLDAVLDGECPHVTSMRSQAAQVAIAFSPLSFITTSSGAFVDSGAAPSRRRSDAIHQLRGSGSPLAAAARERTFKAGHKNSTFPWANTATALHDLIGRRWLVTQIAVLGAASPHRLGYTKKPGCPAFGPDGHPAELLAQTRNNASSTIWWTQQLEQTPDEIGRAEWALALWSVADGRVLDSLFEQWAAVVTSLAERRRQTLLRSCEIVAQTGWLARRQVTITTTDDTYQHLIDLRARTSLHTPGADPARRTPSAFSTAPPDSLLAAARREKWFKVDSQASYR